MNRGASEGSDTQQQGEAILSALIGVDLRLNILSV